MTPGCTLLLLLAPSSSTDRPNRKIVATVSTQTGRVDPSATVAEDA